MKIIYTLTILFLIGFGLFVGYWTDGRLWPYPCHPQHDPKAEYRRKAVIMQRWLDRWTGKNYAEQIEKDIARELPAFMKLSDTEQEALWKKHWNERREKLGDEIEKTKQFRGFRTVGQFVDWLCSTGD